MFSCSKANIFWTKILCQTFFRRTFNLLPAYVYYYGNKGWGSGALFFLKILFFPYIGKKLYLLLKPLYLNFTGWTLYGNHLFQHFIQGCEVGQRTVNSISYSNFNHMKSRGLRSWLLLWHSKYYRLRSLLSFHQNFG